MKKVVLITGANGVLAKQLASLLESQYSVRFLTRKVIRKNEYLWDIEKQFVDTKALEGVHHIIHLAGASIANKRWTDKRKQIILSSRVDSAHLILNELKKHQLSLDSFISASAIGYYGTKTTDEIFDEDSPKGNDFLSDVCSKWENIAFDFKAKEVAKKVAIIRIGIILSENEGALKKMMQPIKFGVGAGLGTGKQYMPWIHIQDLVRIFQLALDNENMNGIFNAVSKQHITNVAFTKTIAQIMRKPIILPNIPKFVFKGLFGEMSSILLEGSKVSSKKIQNTGFKFKYEKLDDALENLLIST